MADGWQAGEKAKRSASCTWDPARSQAEALQKARKMKAEALDKAGPGSQAES